MKKLIPNHGSIPSDKMPKVDKSASYSIQVVGYLDQSWSDRLGGMSISNSQRDPEIITTLVGDIRDQAALFGVLKALYDMRMPLLSVECLEGS